MLAEIAVCLPLSRTFIYELPERAEIGCRVKVRFRSNEVEGFVVGYPKEPPAGVEIQPVREVLKSALPPGITRKHLDRFDAGSVTETERPDSPFKLTTEQLTALYAIEK